MNTFRYPTLVGLAAAASTTLFSATSVLAAPTVFEVTSGVESLTFPDESLSLLEDVGLTLTRVEQTTPSLGGYDYGFDLVPPPATTSKISVDFETGQYAFLGGVEQLIGSVIFEVDTDKLDLDPTLELGDFLIALESTEQVRVIDTISTDLPILDIFPSSSPVFDFEEQSWVIDPVDVLASQEFSDFLIAAGSTTDIAGERLVVGRLDRGFQAIDTPTSIPEPNLPAVFWVGIGGAIVFHKWSRHRPSTSANVDLDKSAANQIQHSVRA